MAQIGRNEPCPCGSGKKYKKCCLGLENSAPHSPTEDVAGSLRQALEDQEFDSLEEVQAFADRFMGQQNKRPLDEFHGLTPEQMYQVLNCPFDAPQIVTFPEKLDSNPGAPILTLFNLLVEAIGEAGLKPTAKGNLPRNFCREVAQVYWDDATYKERTRFGQINKEEDFIELHVVRVVAELAGFLRKYRGRFILSQDCRQLLKSDGMTVVYPRLLRTYIERFNWGYWDRYAEVPFVQHSFLFTLYLLHLYGDDWQSSVIYEDLVLKAFPSVLEEIEEQPYGSPEENFRSCYTWRSFERFAAFMGLAEVERSEKLSTFVTDLRIKKRPLLDAAVRWVVARG